MSCTTCEIRKKSAVSVRYFMECLDCCCDLVLSARPSKLLAGAMLAAIERHPGSPGRVKVLESVRQRLEKPL